MQILNFLLDLDCDLLLVVMSRKKLVRVMHCVKR